MMSAPDAGADASSACGAVDAALCACAVVAPKVSARTDTVVDPQNVIFLMSAFPPDTPQRSRLCSEIVLIVAAMGGIATMAG